jgi:hypothetical protein
MHHVTNFFAKIIESPEEAQLRDHLKLVAELGKLAFLASTVTSVAFGVFFLGSGGFFGMIGFVSSASSALLSYDGYLMCKSLSDISEKPAYFTKIRSNSDSYSTIKEIFQEISKQTFIIRDIVNIVILILESNKKK